MGKYLYINFYFRDLIFDNNYYMGVFSSPDDKIFCRFIYNRKTGVCEIWDNSQPAEDILPLPIYWLDKKMRENGKLKSVESKISY